MINVKVTCSNGNTWITGINADLEGAKAYFLGQTFTHENDETGEETHNTVVSVELAK